MNELLHKMLFRLLSESLQITTKQMYLAYETFVKQVETLN